MVSGNSSVGTEANNMLASAANFVDSSLTTTFWDAKYASNGTTPLTGNQD